MHNELPIRQQILNLCDYRPRPYNKYPSLAADLTTNVLLSFVTAKPANTYIFAKLGNKQSIEVNMTSEYLNITEVQTTNNL